MGKKKGMGLGITLVILVLAFLVVGLTGTALAVPDPAYLGDAGDLTPHGGYGTGTDYCLQCHSAHGSSTAVGEALISPNNVTDVCATCHSVGGVGSTGPADPGFDPQSEAVASTEAAYKYGDPTLLNPGTTATSVSSAHRIGATAVPTADSLTAGNTTVVITSIADEWVYRWSGQQPGETGVNGSDPGELECTSCHTPHGNFGQLVNYASDSHRWTAANPATSAGWVWATDGTDSLGTMAKARIVDGTRAWYHPLANQIAGLNAGTGTPTPCIPASASNPLGGTPVACAAGTPYYGYLRVDAQTNASNATAPAGRLPSNSLLWCADAGLTNCVSMRIADRDGNESTLTGYKMLSAYPNHQWTNPKSWYTDYRGHDVPGWCGTCHPDAVDSANLSAAAYTAWTDVTGAPAGTSHAHPTACTACHGNADPSLSGGTQQTDFPHQSAAETLLVRYPDALCITGCHSEPGLP